MPIYDFKCECGNTEEIYQEMEEKHELICGCGKSMNRIYSKMSFVIGDRPRWWEPKRMDGEADRRAYLRKEELGGRRIKI